MIVLNLNGQEIIKIDETELQIKYLKEGKNQYLVYIEKPDKSIVDISIWERTIFFKKHNNEEVIIIEQHWKNQDTLRHRYIYSINKYKNFQPIYQYSKNGRDVVEAFNFEQDKIIAADSIANNAKKDFYKVLIEPTLNWELDLETFQLLPFEKGTNFKISFYHPGSKSEPKFYNYNVIGEENLNYFDDGIVECWLLKIVYSEGSNATYWIGKQDREVIKMLEESNGVKRYKIKLNSNDN
ncbi:hypothetical protein GCM10011531_27110 [Aquaticitalea lipolytica]|uniref:Uncharacterized protein n=1 Tax=Aquaticitalea lipolytica TaxID=1247562 RepID=A0A8J2TUZ8_9FLAO|nr:hypothetical protein [Aquaticitalea lipolytica]GFZ93769.1 hypothetical protein GCM10011531_27110 [Aquaticitalea lipolytica]